MATKYLGNALLLKVESPADSGNYFTIGASTEHTISWANEQVDVSDKDGDRWKELLAAGDRVATITMNGFISDDTYFEEFDGYADNDTIVNYQLTYAAGTLVIGKFHVDSIEKTGARNDGQGFSTTLTSSEEPMQGSYPDDFLQDEAGDVLLDETGNYIQGKP